jgi:hypothetical protein
MAREAIALHLEGLIEEGELIPEPGSLEQHRRFPQYRSGIWAIVSIDPSNLRLRARRINITMPERVLDSVDRFAAEKNETRSGLLAKAARAYIKAESLRSKSPRAMRRGRKRRGRSSP